MKTYEIELKRESYITVTVEAPIMASNKFLLQDECRGLSRWLASRPGARYLCRVPRTKEVVVLTDIEEVETTGEDDEH